MTQDPKLRIFSDRDALSLAAADLFVELMKKSVAARGRFTVAIPGGTSPVGIYTLLGSPRYNAIPAWKATHVFWVDERMVPPNHPDSNFKLAFDLFLSRVPIGEAQIHRIKGEAAVEEAAQQYEKLLRSSFGASNLPEFDLIILGAGTDGHVASLFPGSAALSEKTRLAIPIHLSPPKLDRVSLSFPVLNYARQVLVLAVGSSKQEIVEGVFVHDNTKQYPAGLIHARDGGALWFIDRDASGTLKEQNSVSS